jgi:hypothetical protein
MSLIVDINPVPWEILEQVKARILRNRANRQKRQPEKPGELRRVMQVDNGILAKQRWEEPSFVGGDVPYIAFVSFDAIDDNFTIKVNSTTIGSVDFSQNQIFKACLFIWSGSDQDHEVVKELINTKLKQERGATLVWANVIAVQDNPPQSSDSVTIEMINIQNNNNSNFGYIYLGFLGDPDPTLGIYVGHSGADLTYELRFPLLND